MTSNLPRAVFTALLAVFQTGLAAEAPTGFDTNRADVQEFIAGVSSRHGFDAEVVSQILGEARPQPRILELIQRPAERTLAWWEYRQRFVNDERIQAGVRVWRENSDLLSRIAASSGVPAEYLVAITGIETSYGRNMGSFRVLDALTTLGFDYAPRGEFFRRELEQFLLLTREENANPGATRGSYAGAMGIAQFMPSSVRAYAVDDTGDGRRDMFGFGPDVFASIANYFLKHGWKPGQPVIGEMSHANPPDDPKVLTLSLSETLASLRARGYVFESSLPEESPAMLIPAQLEESVSWRVGYQNFYVITRYNRSALYAMAVHELAVAIANRYQAVATAARQ